MNKRTYYRIRKELRTRALIGSGQHKCPGVLRYTRIADLSGLSRQLGASRADIRRVYDLLVRERVWKENPPRPMNANLQDRLERMLAERCWALIRARRLTTTAGLHAGLLKVVERKREGEGEREGDGFTVLFEAAYPYRYSSRVGTWMQYASYLYGRDDNGPFVVRVASTCGSIRQALDWMTPHEVRAAQDNPAAQVKRQGDVFLVGRRRGKDHFAVLQGTRHALKSHRQGGYTLVHPEHFPVRLSGALGWRAYLARQDVGAGARRGD